MRMLSHESADFGGFKRLFEDFYEEVRKAIELEIAQLGGQAAVHEYVQRVSEFVMRRLYATLWNRDRLRNLKDKLYRDKSRALSWV